MAGPNRGGSHAIARTVGHDGWQHQLNRKRGERFGECERDGVVVHRGDGAQQLVGALQWRDERRINKRRERVDDVTRGQFVAVVKADAAAQRDDIRERRRVLEGLGELGDDLQALVELEQAVEDEGVQLL